MSRPPTAAGPARSTPVAERALAPDLARGAMLLLIALANTPWFLYATRPGAVQMHPTPGSVADSIVQAVIITTTDGRAYPMFAFLFAYGIGQLYARQTASGTPPKQARRLLRVRHLWMIVIGAAHALLLWAGDIIGVYGLVGLVLVPLFFGRKDATIKVWLIILFVFGAIMSVLSLLSGAFAPAGAGPSGNPMAEARIGISDPDYLSSALARITGYVFTLPMMAFLLLSIPTAFLCGILASRHRILDEPGRHLPLLRRVAVIGVGVGWLGGAATAAEHLGGPSVAHGWAYFVPQFYTGVFAGIGYAAAFGLAAHAIARRRRPAGAPVVAMVALGRRSLSGYLAQSIMFAPLLSAWGLGLGARLSSWSMAFVAIAGWLVTLGLAYLTERAGLRGPAEVGLRRLVYRPRRRVEAGAPSA